MWQCESHKYLQGVNEAWCPYKKANSCTKSFWSLPVRRPDFKAVHNSAEQHNNRWPIWLGFLHGNNYACACLGGYRAAWSLKELGKPTTLWYRWTTRQIITEHSYCSSFSSSSGKGCKAHGILPASIWKNLMQHLVVLRREWGAAVLCLSRAVTF